MMQYVEHTIPGETLIDSDRESNKSEEGDVAKEQRMFIWNQKFEVCVCVCTYLTCCKAIGMFAKIWPHMNFSVNIICMQPR